MKKQLLQQTVQEDLEMKHRMKEQERLKELQEKKEASQLFKYNNDRMLQREIEYK